MIMHTGYICHRPVKMDVCTGAITPGSSLAPGQKEIQSKDLYWSKLELRLCDSLRDSLGPAQVQWLYLAPNGTSHNHQWASLAGLHWESLFSLWREAGVGWKEGKEVHQLSCLITSRTKVWTSPVCVIYYPSCTLHPLNSENFHVSLNFWQPLSSVEKEWEFGTVSMSKAT